MTATVDGRARPPTALALDAVRLLREGTWLRSLVLVVAFSTSCALLGHWQWTRHQDKSVTADRLRHNYTTAPTALTQILPTPETAFTLSSQWRQVRATGTYLTDRTVLIRNRSFNGSYGYEVVVPLRTASGAAFLVDRGWIPNGRTGSVPDDVPAPPSGPVDVVARLHPSEPTSQHRTPPSGQALQIDVAQLSADLGIPTYRAYGVLASETPAPGTAPHPLPEPQVDLGNNLAYAFQWWFFAAGAVVLLGYYGFREAQNRDLRARGIDPAVARKRRSRPEPEDEEEW